MVLFLNALAAQARTCQDLFPTNPLASLESHLARIYEEQNAARSRDWTPDQIEEIRKKGRLEFNDQERAIKYYRGLIVWKARLLEQALAEKKERALFEELKGQWPQSVSIDGREIFLFQYRPDFLSALKLAQTLLKTENPQAPHIASLLSVMAELRASRRSSWIDPAKLETKIFDRLRPHFPEISSVKFSDLSDVAFAPRIEKITCCGSGRCESCTHPNVVFRAKEKWPGPTYDGPSPKSTLPLYRVMDQLRLEFPDEVWGQGFWDLSVPVANR